MIQGILVTLIFVAAVAYLIRSIYLQLNAKSACTTGCGKCGAIDFNQIEKQLNTKFAVEKDRF